MELQGRLLLWMVAACFCTPGLAGVVTVLEPNGVGIEQTGEGIEFSAYVKGNRWDMSDPADIITTESGFLTDQTFSDGVFRALSVEDDVPDGKTDAKFFLIYPGVISAALSAESGHKFPIDTSLYRKLTLKIRHLDSAGNPSGLSHGVQVFFFEDEKSFQSATFGYTTHASVVSDGSWHIVEFDLIDDLSPGSKHGWTEFSEVKGLRIDPTLYADTRIEVDWVRLTAPGDANTRFNVQWSGGSAPYSVTARRKNDVDVTLATDLAGTSADVDFSRLPSGDYTIEVLGGLDKGTSTGKVHVNEAPVFHFLQPDIRGDVDNSYSIVETGNPWGPIDAADVSMTVQLSGISYSSPVGSLTATTTGGDSSISMNTPVVIDTNKYRMLSYTMSVSGARDIGVGSVARVFWGDTLSSMKTSEDIIVQEGLNTYELGDLRNLPLEGGAINQWQGSPLHFRLDPHEFPYSKNIRLDNVTLAPLDTAAPVFEITWQDGDSDSDAAIDIYADIDQVPGNANEVLIATGISENSASNRFTWNAPSDVEDGEYFLYASINDGLNQTTRYATGPIAVGDGVPIEVTISQPDGINDSAAAADEFSSDVEGNEWDMSDSNDVPFAHSNHISPQSISAGRLTGTSTGDDPSFYLLYPGPTAGHSGSNGIISPISTSRFRYLTFKVRYSGAASPPLFQVFFMKDNSFGPSSVGFTNFLPVEEAGQWQVITIDLGAESASASPFSWSAAGQIRGLRIDPVNTPGVSWEFDWFTLTGDSGADGQYLVRWTATDPGLSSLTISAVDDSGLKIPLLEGVAPENEAAIVNLARLPVGDYFIHADAIPGPSDLSTGAISLVREIAGSDSELLNLATRTDVRTGDNITIAGFIITGSTQKCVVVQGLGPSVGVPAGVSRLPDPVLTLKSGSTTIAQNDNWPVQENPADLSTITSLGGSFVPGDVLEAAIYKCLDPGAYTALLTGYLNTTGVGMAAVYDADSGAAYLSNIATRSWVGTGHRISIAGFVITGDRPKQILVRGLGPSMLSKFPPGSRILMNPELKLYRGSELIASNDDWGNAANAGEIGALSANLRPADTREPAILMVLEPGLYTAHLLGEVGGTGNGNVAVYDLTGR